MHLYQLSHILSSNIIFKEKYLKGQFKSGSLKCYFMALYAALLVSHSGILGQSTVLRYYFDSVILLLNDVFSLQKRPPFVSDICCIIVS